MSTSSRCLTSSRESQSPRIPTRDPWPHSSIPASSNERCTLPRVAGSNLSSRSPGSAEAERDFNFVNSQGLRYEAAEATRCVREGALESELFGSDECLRVMQLVSEIRARFKA